MHSGPSTKGESIEIKSWRGLYDDTMNSTSTNPDERHGRRSGARRKDGQEQGCSFNHVKAMSHKKHWTTVSETKFQLSRALYRKHNTTQTSPNPAADQMHACAASMLFSLVGRESDRPGTRRRKISLTPTHLLPQATRDPMAMLSRSLRTQLTVSQNL